MTYSDVNRLKMRFKNLLDVQKGLQIEKISATFTEYDLKEIVFALGYLVAVMAKQEVTEL